MEVNRHMDTGSRLTVRAYHVEDVSYGGENRITVDGKMTICSRDLVGRSRCEPERDSDCRLPG